MKPMTTYFFILLSLTLSISLPPYTSASRPSPTATSPTPGGGGNQIVEACKSSAHKDQCVAALESDPNGKKSGIKQLAVIALRQASTNAINTEHHIKELLKKENLEPGVEQSLTDCSKQFLDAVEQLDSSLAATLAKAYNDVETWVGAAISDAENCESGFRGSEEHKINVADMSRMFRQLCDNALSVNKALGVGER